MAHLLAYAAEATAKLVLIAAARNPGHRHRRNDHPERMFGGPERLSRRAIVWTCFLIGL